MSETCSVIRFNHKPTDEDVRIISGHALVEVSNRVRKSGQSLADGVITIKVIDRWNDNWEMLTEWEK